MTALSQLAKSGCLRGPSVTSQTKSWAASVSCNHSSIPTTSSFPASRRRRNFPAYDLLRHLKRPREILWRAQSRPSLAYRILSFHRLLVPGKRFSKVHLAVVKRGADRKLPPHQRFDSPRPNVELFLFSFASSFTQHLPIGRFAGRTIVPNHDKMADRYRAAATPSPSPSPSPSASRSLSSQPDSTRTRLPTLFEVLSRRTLPPVDLFSFYIYMRDQQRSVDYLDFW